ncbi:MAG: hypothetical protein M1541_04975 [Acidobacteria bacterium]|nr:hypothetical protein [Acidobacteriota bacterium]
MFPPVPVPSEGPQIPANLPASASFTGPLVIASAKKKEPQQDDDEDLLKEAQERFRRCLDAERAWRKQAEEELNFLAGEHWDGQMKEERKGRPCLTFDRISPSIDQVINHARQNPPEPKVAPVGNGADKPTAEILQGLIRNIENDSRADIAYFTGYKHAVQIGRGWWRVLNEWEDETASDTEELSPDLFFQKLVIKRVPNPFSIYPDPAAVEFDRRDMRFCFATEDLDLDLYKDLYPNSKVAGFTGDFTGVGDRVRTDWFPRGCVRVAEYWRVTEGKQVICYLENGLAVPASAVPPGMTVRARRTRQVQHISAAKLNGMEVLERWGWKGRWIPFIPCLGDEIIKNGKTELRGMIRPAMDANLIFDYMSSKLAEGIALAPLSQWLVAEGQLENHEYKWADANRKAFAYLEYKPQDVNGQPVPPPIRINSGVDVSGIVAAIQIYDNNTKAALSTYDASLGNAGPESSGRAILARQSEGDNAHFHYHDNLSLAMRHTARVLVDLIPHVYPDSRAISIFDPDGSIRQVYINTPFIERGLQKIYRIGEGAGRYDITLGSGQSFASRRAQGADALMELTRTIPASMARALDLVVKALDIPDADQLADRLRPPDIQEQADGAPPVPVPIQMKMAQQAQAIQALTAELQKLQQLLASKALDLASREKIAAMDNSVKLIIEDLKAGATHSTALMQEQFAAIKHQLDMLAQHQGAGQQPGGQQQEPPGAGAPQSGEPASQAPAAPAAEPAAPAPAPAEGLAG